MKDRVDEEIVRYLWRLRAGARRRHEGGAGVPRGPRRRRAAAPMTLERAVRRRPASPFGAIAARRRRPRAPRGGEPPQPARVGGDDVVVKTVRRDEPKVGRNDPCPCGSGKKYKKCHGAAA